MIHLRIQYSETIYRIISTKIVCPKIGFFLEEIIFTMKFTFITGGGTTTGENVLSRVVLSSPRSEQYSETEKINIF